MKKLMIAALCLMLVLPLAAGAEELQAAPTEHSHSWTTDTVLATCTQGGSTQKTCSCGATETTTTPALGHSWGGWTNGGDSHSHACTVCGISESAGHSWGEAQTITAATCTATGTRTYTCSCGATKSETIPMTDHAYGAWTVADATHSRSCACGKTESASHSWQESAVVAATCLKEGSVAYTCSTCGATKTEPLPKLTTHTYDHVCDPDCNICGAVRDASHKPNVLWSKNASGHWHPCSACGEKLDLGNHYPGPAATEEKAQICLTCGYTLTAKKGHVHQYETQWTSDETGHWNACSGCEDQKNFEFHNYDDGCDSDCNICGYLTPTAHDYSGDWFCDETGHWDICTICQELSAPEPHVPGPDATETDAQVCLTCNFELAPVLEPTEHIHTAEGTWLTDAESHWKNCACGEETEKQPHIWDAGEEQEDTTILYTCEDCGFTRTEGEPKATGINPLIWIGGIIVALVAAAAGIAFVLVSRLRKGKKGK